MREILAAKGGTMGKKGCSVILPTWRLFTPLGIFYMPQIYDMGPTQCILNVFLSKNYEKLGSKQSTSCAEMYKNIQTVYSSYPTC